MERRKMEGKRGLLVAYQCVYTREKMICYGDAWRLVLFIFGFGQLTGLNIVILYPLTKVSYEGNTCI
jgi:hypothetical protein